MSNSRRFLIPRYNWDFSFADFLQAVFSLFRQRASAEETFETIFGQRPLLTTSGRVSLFLILRSLGLPARARVGVPLFCCPVVFDTVVRAGFQPVFIDINDTDFTISADDLRRKIKNIDALILVHMFGNVSDTSAMTAICGHRPVIEDCAHALYSERDGQYAGFCGIYAFFSFRSGKYLSVGEGSAIFCSNPAIRSHLEEQVRKLPNWTFTQTIIHAIGVYVKSLFYRKPLYGLVGYTLGRKLDASLNLTAKEGFLLRSASKADLRTICRRVVAYQEKINEQRSNSLWLLSHLRLRNAVLPSESKGCISNYYQFPLRFRNQVERDTAADYLFTVGIDTAKYADGVPELARSRFDYKNDCPVSERCSQTTLVVPNHYSLSKEDLGHIVKHLHEIDVCLDGVNLA